MATKKEITTETTEAEIISPVNEKKSVWATLSAINVNEHTEKKAGLTYLSWAWAWSKVKEHYPDATYTIYETPEGLPYWTDSRTCWVKTGVTIQGLEHIEYLPVMDNRNQSIPLGKVTSMDMNKAIQRSLTKACARHGLGLYIYAGEDLPEVEAIEAKEVRYGKAFEEVRAAKSRDEVVAVYHRYKEYHSDEAFVAICQQVTRELEQNPIINNK